MLGKSKWTVIQAPLNEGGQYPEPWQMTRAEYAPSVDKLMEKFESMMPRNSRLNKDARKIERSRLALLRRSRIEGHKAAVQQALSEDKPVPPEVLADYPDLAAHEVARPPSVAKGLVLQTGVDTPALRRLIEGPRLPAPTRPVEVVPEAVAKEPWQMTRAEYVEEGRKWRAEHQPRLTGRALEHELEGVSKGHKGVVRNAIEEGKPVPTEVLADYSDLKE